MKLGLFDENKVIFGEQQISIFIKVSIVWNHPLI